jgi:hypothetical protein
MSRIHPKLNNEMHKRKKHMHILFAPRILLFHAFSFVSGRGRRMLRRVPSGEREGVYNI